MDFSQRRAVLESVVTGNDPAVRPADRLNALEQLTRLDVEEASARAAVDCVIPEPGSEVEAFKQLDGAMAAFVMAAGFTAGRTPEARAGMPRTVEALAEVYALAYARGRAAAVHEAHMAEPGHLDHSHEPGSDDTPVEDPAPAAPPASPTATVTGPLRPTVSRQTVPPRPRRRRIIGLGA